MQWKFSNAFSVGPSSYGDRRGIEQFVTDRRVALQVLTIVIIFNGYLRQKGRHGSLSINEAKRTRPRQSWLYANRFRLGVKVAVPFTSPHDEVNHGNAIDFGITMPDGSNRALYADEFAVLHSLVEGHGGTWTGVNFNEPWHHEMATRAELALPFPDARERLIGKPKPSKPAPTPPPAPKPKSRPKVVHDMIGIRSEKTGQARLIGELTVQDLSDAEARTFSKGVAGDGSFFQTMSSEDCKTHIRLVEARRAQANLPILQAITDAIAKES